MAGNESSVIKPLARRCAAKVPLYLNSWRIKDMTRIDDIAYEDCLTPFAPQWQGIYEQKAREIIEKLSSLDERSSR